MPGGGEDPEGGGRKVTGAALATLSVRSVRPLRPEEHQRRQRDAERDDDRRAAVVVLHQHYQVIRTEP